MFDWFKGNVRCPNHSEREAQVYCRVCKRSFCPDCVDMRGEYYVCRSDSCRGGYTSVKRSEENERQQRLREDAREERRKAKEAPSPSRTFFRDLRWHGWGAFILYPLRGLLGWLFSKADKGWKK